LIEDSEYVLLEIHYKAPEADGILDDDAVSDSGGMSKCNLYLAKRS
jgi:hypothetical protein